jgi:ubiquinone/menaquinone biosynthesis C-methylase UbiE
MAALMPSSRCPVMILAKCYPAKLTANSKHAVQYVSVDVMQSKTEVQAFYDRRYQRGRPRKCSAIYDVGKRLRMVIASFLDGLDGDVILDLGCGAGSLTNLLLGRFKLVVGVDISRVGVKIANARAEESLSEGKCNFIVADALHLPFRRECFDAVVMSEVLEHLYDQKQALMEANRLLKPHSHFILTTPNRFYSDVAQLMFKFARKRFQFDQIVENQLYPASLRNLVKTFFNIEKERGVFFTVPLIERFNSPFLLSLRNWLSETLENSNCFPEKALHQCLLCCRK